MFLGIEGDFTRGSRAVLGERRQRTRKIYRPRAPGRGRLARGGPHTSGGPSGTRATAAGGEKGVRS